MSQTNATTIVVGNEKGGAGKSTIAIHLATALLHAGAKVAVLDLDLRQRSTARFFENRAAWAAANDAVVPMPLDDVMGHDGEALAKSGPAEQLRRFEEAYAQASRSAEMVIIDTPGSDTDISRIAHSRAQLIVTPLNDSFVDFDMLGQVDPVTLDLVKPSFYAMTVWEARKNAMLKTRRSVDWLVLRNRLATFEARNRKRLDERIDTLAKRVGFRVGPGLRERVIYRELFPFGLTVADLSPTIRPVQVSLSHVAARQELRAIMVAMGFEGLEEAAVPPPPAATAGEPEVEDEMTEDAA